MVTKKTFSRICSILFVMVFILAGVPLQGVHAVGLRYATPGGTGACSGWGGDACSLQTALTGASSGDEIWVQAGTYKPTTISGDRNATFQLVSGVAVYGGFAGTESALNQRVPAATTTILSGDLNGDDEGFTNNSENVFHVVTGVTGATLDGFTITAGNANGSQMYGGGMYNSSSSPTVTHIIFSDNSAAYGGGMSNDSSSPTLTDVTFSHNAANSGNSGGGMYNNSSSPALTNVTFSNNSAGYGGGLFNHSGGNPTLRMSPSAAIPS